VIDLPGAGNRASGAAGIIPDQTEASLDGRLINAGGIGENAPEIRARICDGLGWAGLEIEPNLNAQTVGKEGQISTADSRLQAWVIPTDEELLIARDTVRCILGEPHPT